ncbi:type I restriction enzyme subunit R domain-containing protein [Enterobacter hormaechei]
MGWMKLSVTTISVMVTILILPATPLLKDLAARLAHKKPYERIHTEPSKQLDLLIVVDQMLTGFDSKWLILCI